MRRLSCVIPICLAFLAGPLVAEELQPHEKAAIEKARQALVVLEKDHQALMADAHLKEKACLARFVSASCLEDLRQEVTKASRDIDLAAETLRESIRQVQADARQRARDARVAAQPKS
ncbi:MAG: hypothetical protein ACO2Z5_03700 [Burkholderiaceae bacterium]|jgi:hypothetical protein